MTLVHNPLFEVANSMNHADLDTYIPTIRNRAADCLGVDVQASGRSLVLFQEYICRFALEAIAAWHNLADALQEQNNIHVEYLGSGYHIAVFPRDPSFLTQVDRAF